MYTMSSMYVVQNSKTVLIVRPTSELMLYLFSEEDYKYRSTWSVEKVNKNTKEHYIKAYQWFRQRLKSNMSNEEYG